MNRKTNFVVIFLLWMTLLASAAEKHPAVNYQTLIVPGSTETDVFGINNSGTLAGFYTKNAASHGMLVMGTHIVNIDDPSAPLNSTVCEGVGPNNECVGYYSTADGHMHAFLFVNGTYTDLVPSGDTTDSVAFNMNKLGHIAGYFIQSDGSEHAFLYTGNNSYKQIDYPGALATLSWGLNDADHVTVQYVMQDNLTHGAKYVNGSFTPLDVPGATQTFPHTIDNTEDVVFTWEDSQNAPHGAFFLNSANKFYKFDAPNGTGTRADGLNDHQTIVGRFQPSGGNPVFAGFKIVY